MFSVLKANKLSVPRVQSSRRARMSLLRKQRRCKTAAAGNSYRVSCSASDFEEGELISGVKSGDKLKVKESRIVYHSPKHKVKVAQSHGLDCT